MHPDRLGPVDPPPLRPRIVHGRADPPAWAVEALSDIRAPLAIDTTATANNAARLRRALTAWLSVDVAEEQVEDLVLAVYEAVANCAEHAYADLPGGVGPVRLTAHRTADDVRVAIADEGHWRPATGAPYRGRGLPMIGRLVQHLHVAAAADGTVVHLRVTLPSSGRA